MPDPTIPTGFSVLDAANPVDFEAWRVLWESWPDREVFAHPAYARLFARPADRTLAAVWRAEQGTALLPLICRPLSAQAWCPEGETGADSISPYGYSGAFCWGPQPPDPAAFWPALDEWARQSGVVTTFLRLSLFQAQILPLPATAVVRVQSPNVVRTLDEPPERLWADYAHKVRKNVQRARREGIRVVEDPDGQALDAFLEVYYGTMDRREAAATYYFPRAFFESLIGELGGSCRFFHAMAGERLVSTELVLVSAHHVYSFLGGTRAEAFPVRPNDLIKHEIVLWAHQAGHDAYVLGGGPGGEDGIYRYKLSFAPRGRVPFRTAALVHDADRMLDWVAARAQYERETAGHAAWTPRPGFFPPYRA